MGTPGPRPGAATRRGRLDVHHAPAGAGYRFGGGPGGSLLGHLGLDALVEERCTLETGIRNQTAVEIDRPDRVIVGGDHEVDSLGAAVAVDDGDDGDSQTSGLVHRNVFLVEIDDEERLGKPRHLLDPFKRLSVLGHLTIDARELLLGERPDPLLVIQEGEMLLEALDRLLDGAEVGEHPAQPAIADVELLGPTGLPLDRDASLSLGGDEEHLAALRDRLAQELEPLPEAHQGLVEIDDVDAVSVPEEVGLHLRIPAPGLVTEVGTGLQQRADREGPCFRGCRGVGGGEIGNRGSLRLGGNGRGQDGRITRRFGHAALLRGSASAPAVIPHPGAPRPPGTAEAVRNV